MRLRYKTAQLKLVLYTPLLRVITLRLYLSTTTGRTMKIYDVTVPIRAGMPIYEGDPAVEIQAWSALAKGDSANVSFLHFGAHTGTHVDAPAHFIEGAWKIDALPLDLLIGPARVVRVADDVTEIDPNFISAAALAGGASVLFNKRNKNIW